MPKRWSPADGYAFAESLDALPEGMIDFHAHIDEAHHLGWIDPPSKLLDLMAEARIATAAVMTYRDASAADPAPAQYVADAVAAHPGRFVGFARIFPSPDDSAADLLTHCVREWGMIGLKLHPVTNLQAPGDPATVRLTHRAAELNLPVLFHCGDEPNCTPYAIEALARQVPQATIVLGHIGGYRHMDDARDVLRHNPQVMVDTSAMPYPARIAEFVGEFGAERVLFGSDGPGAPPRLEVRKVLLSDLPDDALELVMRDNAARLIAAARAAAGAPTGRLRAVRGGGAGDGGAGNGGGPGSSSGSEPAPGEHPPPGEPSSSAEQLPPTEAEAER